MQCITQLVSKFMIACYGLHNVAVNTGPALVRSTYSEMGRRKGYSITTFGGGERPLINPVVPFNGMMADILGQTPISCPIPISL